MAAAGAATPDVASERLEGDEDARKGAIVSAASLGDTRSEGVSEESVESNVVRRRLHLAFVLPLGSPAGLRFGISEKGWHRVAHTEIVPCEPDRLPDIALMLDAVGQDWCRAASHLPGSLG